MADVTGETIFARARTEATQKGLDPNQSTVIDNKGGLRAMLNEAIRTLYRAKAVDPKFLNDIVTRHTIACAASVGPCPDEIMREHLGAAQFQDDAGSLITFYDYNVDYASGQNYLQLGYCVMRGDNFLYTAPNDTAYDGNLFVTVPSFPELPVSMSSNISFPSLATIDDLCSLLAEMLVGGVKVGA